MKKRRFSLIASIIFIIAAGIWYQVSYPVSDTKEQISSLDESYHDEFYGNTNELGEETKRNSLTREQEGTEAPGDLKESAEPVDTESSFRKCCYICGFVEKPGVYEFEDDERLSDVVTKAGGFSKGACKEYLNLARFCEDGERIYVPSQEEVQDKLEPEEQSIPSQDGKTDRELSNGSETEQASRRDKININTADEGSLTTLPGIGEAKAKRILSYREEHGRFGSIEEIKNIEGIKDGVFQKIQELITVQS